VAARARRKTPFATRTLLNTPWYACSNNCFFSGSAVLCSRCQNRHLPLTTTSAAFSGSFPLRHLAPYHHMASLDVAIGRRLCFTSHRPVYSSPITHASAPCPRPGIISRAHTCTHFSLSLLPESRGSHPLPLSSPLQSLLSSHRHNCDPSLLSLIC
jgi:hypothetical protein